MSLKDTIGNDMKAAMKQKDQLRLDTLRMLRAALMEKEIERRGAGQEMSPEDELGVLTATVKKHRESMRLFEQGGRMDLVEKEAMELAVVQEYLPKQMSREEVEAAVRGILTETGAEGAKDFGKVMPLAIKLLKGKADGSVIQATVRKLLGA